MRILTEAQCATAIRKCKPKKVAVAFLGADWKKFIPDTDILEYVVVSPEFGTNPKAVRQLAAKIGWERVHLLDGLHAKAYLGDQGAVVGSANLTRNGLAGNRLIELCVSVRSEGKLSELERLLDTWRAQAERQYPTKSTKIAKMEELDVLWSEAFIHGISAPPSQGTLLKDFSLTADDQFYVCWYQYTEEVDKSEEAKMYSSLTCDEMHFAKDDAVERGKWVLAWKAKGDLYPYAVVRPYWFFIHEVFEDGIIEKGYEYPQLAIQRTDWGVPPEPFELTDEVIAAFKGAMHVPKFRKYFVQDDEDDIFRIGKSHKGLPALVEYMKEQIRV